MRATSRGWTRSRRLDRAGRKKARFPNFCGMGFVFSRFHVTALRCPDAPIGGTVHSHERIIQSVSDFGFFEKEENNDENNRFLKIFYIHILRLGTLHVNCYSLNISLQLENIFFTISDNPLKISIQKLNHVARKPLMSTFSACSFFYVDDTFQELIKS